MPLNYFIKWFLKHEIIFNIKVKVSKETLLKFAVISIKALSILKMFNYH